MSTLATGAGRARPPRPIDHAPLHDWEVHAMNAQIQYVQAVHADRLARLYAEAHQARLARLGADRHGAPAPRARSFARAGRPAARRRGVRPGAADRAPDAGRFPLMRDRPASPTSRETFK